MIHRVSDGDLLRDRRVLVIAVTPTDQGFGHSTAIEAEEALIGIVRAVIAEGGTVELIADDSLALLGAIVAGEYFEPQPAESVVPRERQERATTERPPLRIHASPDEEGILATFFEGGQADAGDPERPAAVIARNAASCSGMVCIGDAPFADYADIFREHNPAAPVFAFAYSGRAANELIARRGVSAVDLQLARVEPPRSSKRELDRQRDDRSPREEAREEEQGLAVDFEFQFPPTALAAQVIVQQIAEHTGETPNNPAIA